MPVTQWNPSSRVTGRRCHLTWTPSRGENVGDATSPGDPDRPRCSLVSMGMAMVADPIA